MAGEYRAAGLAVRFQVNIVGRAPLRMAQDLVSFRDGPKKFRISSFPVIGMESLRLKPVHAVNRLLIGPAAHLQNFVIIQCERSFVFILTVGGFKSQPDCVSASGERPAVNHPRIRLAIWNHAYSVALDQHDTVGLEQQAHVDPNAGIIKVHYLGRDVGPSSGHVLQHHPGGAGDMHGFAARFPTSL